MTTILRRIALTGIFMALWLAAWADEPVFFDHYVVVDGDTLDISGLYEYKMREYLAEQGLNASLMDQLAKPVDWPRTLTTLSVGIGLKLGIDHTLKHTVGELRPDGSDRHSFPSRHATWAYGIGAKVSYMFAPYCQWVMPVAQTAANAIGFQRVMTRQHYPHDVLGGAAIGIATDLISREVGNWIFGREPLFPAWRSSRNANAAALSMSTGATLPLARTYGDARLGTTLLRSDFTCLLPVAPRWAFVTDLSLESGFLTTADGFNHNINMLGAQAGIQYHYGHGPYGLATSASVGYCASLPIASVDTSRGSVIGGVSVSPTLMVTPKLALGLTGGATVSRLTVNGVTRTVPALTLALQSKAFF